MLSTTSYLNSHLKCIAAYIAKEVMGSRRGTSSRKSVVPGIIRTKADAPMKTSRQRRRTGGASSKSTSDAKISCAKAKKSAMETTIPIKRTTGEVFIIFEGLLEVYLNASGHFFIGN